MAVCAIIDASGYFQTTTTAIGSCTDFVILTASDYATSSPVYTSADVVEMSMLVVSAWAAAYAIKLLRKAL